MQQLWMKITDSTRIGRLLLLLTTKCILNIGYWVEACKWVSNEPEVNEFHCFSEGQINLEHLTETIFGQTLLISWQNFGLSRPFSSGNQRVKTPKKKLWVSWSLFETHIRKREPIVTFIWNNILDHTGKSVSMPLLNVVHPHSDIW